MQKMLLFLMLGACLFACTPQNKEQTLEIAADTTNLEKLADSAKHKTEPDGTLVLSTKQDDRRQLPPDLKLLLDSLHPGWELPEVTDTALALALAKPQGPYFVAGYFNPDNYKDYVVQIIDNNRVKVFAFIKSEREVRHQEVYQEPTFNRNRKTVVSPFALFPAQKQANEKLITLNKSDRPEPEEFMLMYKEDSTTYHFADRNGLLFFPRPKSHKD